MLLKAKPREGFASCSQQLGPDVMLSIPLSSRTSQRAAPHVWTHTHLTGTDGVRVPKSLWRWDTAEPSQEPLGSKCWRVALHLADPCSRPSSGSALSYIHLSRARSSPRESSPGSKKPFYHQTVTAGSYKEQERSKAAVKVKETSGKCHCMYPTTAGHGSAMWCPKLVCYGGLGRGAGTHLHRQCIWK